MAGNKGALVIAALCAFIASIIVYQMMKEKNVPKIVKIPQVDVVFAKETIAAHSLIRPAQLEIRKVPKEAAGPNTVGKLEDVNGMITKTDILSGEAINKRRLLAKGEKPSLSLVIPKGKRAITIAVNEVIGVAGFIKPGERVDLLGTVEIENRPTSVAWTIVQDVTVLAVSQDMGGTAVQGKGETVINKSQAKLGTSITLAVTPEQAQKITLAEKKGELRLILRPFIKEDQMPIAPVKEGNLLPGVPVVKKVRPSVARAPVLVRPKKRQIEVISGSKSQMVTVD